MVDAPGMNPIDDPTNSRSQAWRVFFRVTGRLEGAIEAALRRTFSLTTADYNILLALWEADFHSLRMGELADRVVYSPSRITYLVSNLVKDGLVERVPSREDGRGFEAILTEAGVARVLAATEVHQQIVRESFLDGMTEEEIDEVVRIFGALEARLNDGNGIEDEEERR